MASLGRKMRAILSHKNYILLSEVVMLVLLLVTTNPSRVPSVLLIVPFVLVYGSIYGIVSICQRMLLGSELHKRQKVIAHICAAFPTALLILSSINQLSIRDFLLFAILLAGGIFYVQRVRFLSAQ